MCVCVWVSVMRVLFSLLGFVRPLTEIKNRLTRKRKKPLVLSVSLYL